MTDQTNHDASYAAPTEGFPAPPDWRWTLAFGIVLILGGVLALANPFIASLTAEAIAATAFIVGGVVQIWVAVTQNDHAASRIGSGLLGALLMLFGAMLVAAPIPGLLSLTLLVAAFFLALGVVRVWLAVKARPRDGWHWQALSGALSIVLAALIYVALPEGALGLLGLFLAVDLLMAGIAAIMGAIALRRAA